MSAKLSGSTKASSTGTFFPNRKLKWAEEHFFLKQQQQQQQKHLVVTIKVFLVVFVFKGMCDIQLTLLSYKLVLHIFPSVNAYNISSSLVQDSDNLK